MKEFGSDFHFIEADGFKGPCIQDLFHNPTMLADGRQCLVALIRQYGWKRIWFPDYFCYEVIETIRNQTDIEILFYEDNPLSECRVEDLPFENCDVLLRMNYFGVRKSRSNANIPCPVIEDHTHDLLSQWALHSDADWCIASVRKTLPLPEGGIMWSPKDYSLTVELPSSQENERIATTRWQGMEMKAAYLNGEDIRKEDFRQCYTETEEWFDQAEPVLIDRRSCDYLTRRLDINTWLRAKSWNWKLLSSLIDQSLCKILMPEDKACNPFSLVMLLESNELRQLVRNRLIRASIYPAVLWALPESASPISRDFSGRMLSIHCDGRYNEADIRQMAFMVNEALMTEI